MLRVVESILFYLCITQLDTLSLADAVVAVWNVGQMGREKILKWAKATSEHAKAR